MVQERVKAYVQTGKTACLQRQIGADLRGGGGPDSHGAQPAASSALQMSGALCS